MDLLTFDLEKALLGISSPQTLQQVYVRFQNCTEHSVELMWIDFKGNLVRYMVLRTGQFLDINTFIDHYWIARDVKNGDPMLLDRQLLYKAIEGWKHCINNFPTIRCPVVPPNVRTLVHITLPLYSLRYRTLLECRKLLKGNEDAEKLDLPKQLINDIKNLIARKKE